MGFTEILFLINIITKMHCEQAFNLNQEITANCKEEITDCILDEGVKQTAWCIENYGSKR